MAKKHALVVTADAVVHQVSYTTPDEFIKLLFTHIGPTFIITTDHACARTRKDGDGADVVNFTKWFARTPDPSQNKPATILTGRIHDNTVRSLSGRLYSLLIEHLLATGECTSVGPHL